MWSEDVFNGSKSIIQWWGYFFNEVSDEYGTEKAIELFLKSWEQLGTAFATSMKTSKEINLNTIANQSVNSFITLGYERSAEVTPTTIIYTTDKCPLYAGFSEAGISHKTIKAICTGIGTLYNDRLKTLYHTKAGYNVKFRSTADDICVEEVILKP